MVENLNDLAVVMVSLLIVRFVAVFVIDSLIVEFFGFFFVPALVGVILTLIDAGAWAEAIGAVMAIAATAAKAVIRNLFKGRPSERGLTT